MKKEWYKYLVILLLCYIVYNLIDFSVHTMSADEVTKSISKKVIRFHVLAESDEKYDQELKLQVKDAVVEYLSPKLADVRSKKEARAIIQKNFKAIKTVAENKIRKQGYNYTVRVYLTYCEFPTKIYEDLTFPAGEYEALRVDIGNAKGKNWWCLMYPPLCFVNETYSVVPEQSKSQLKQLLTSKEYDTLCYCRKTKVEYRFKIVEIFKKLF